MSCWGCSRPCPPADHRDDDGALRVVLRPHPADVLVRPVLASVRSWGTGDTSVVLATVELAGRLLAADPVRCGTSALAVTVREEVVALVESYRAGAPHAVDAARVDRALAEVLEPADGGNGVTV